MEVHGKISTTQSDIVMCKPCEDDGKRVQANGMCQECEQHMCIGCFGNHKKYTICKDHTLIDSNTSIDYSCSGDVSEMTDDSFEVCPKHNNEALKFYCQRHDEVGCGDCMIMQHKACKVEYIRDIADKFIDSKEFSDIVSQIDCCQNEASKCSSSIKNNKIQIEDIHLGFLADVKTFRDEINAHLEKLEERVLQERSQVKGTDKNRIESLETACAELDSELAEMSDEIVNKSDNPNKLFVTAKEYKNKTNTINRKLCSITLKNKIIEYRFERNRILEQILQQVELGTCLTVASHHASMSGYDEPGTCLTTASRHASVSGYEEPVNTNVEHVYSDITEVKLAQGHLPARGSSQKKDDYLEPVKLPTRRPSQRKDTSNWSLFDHQLRCENLLMAGEYLSYKENEKCELGLYIGKKPIKQGTYFEIEIVSSGSNGNIGIGFVPKDYSCRHQPGHGRYSVGYHTKDGCMYDQSTSGEKIGPPCTVGDVIGIGVSSYLSNVFKTKVCIFFTRNRKKVREIESNSPSFSKLYPAIGMQAAGDKIKVILNAKEP